MQFTIAVVEWPFKWFSLGRFHSIMRSGEENSGELVALHYCPGLDWIRCIA